MSETTSIFGLHSLMRAAVPVVAAGLLMTAPMSASVALAGSSMVAQAMASQSAIQTSSDLLLPAFAPDSNGVLTLAPMLDRVTPAVVSVSVATTRSQNAPTVNGGSGVIVDARQGYILTNHHLVEDARQIRVTLKDGRTLTATLIGTDPATDIAVLQVSEGSLIAVSFARSDQVRVGDLAIAIGNPFGLGQAVSMGVISGLGRSGLIQDGYEDFIQTDAAINVGNSGGALVNSKGELVGINTAILSRTGGNVGIGFAVPSDIAETVLNQIVESGSVTRGKLGVAIQTVSPPLAERLGLRVARGVLVAEVFPNTAASAAGLRTGDVILALNGKAIEDSADLRRQIGLGRIGQALRLRLLRDGDVVDIQTSIGQ